jgi:type II secretory pathway pseudopilin PulG
VLRGERRRGVALLEAIVALTILAFAGIVAVSLTASAAGAVHRVRGAEQDLRAANAFLAAVSLWTRADFDRHLGDRVQGGWIMRVDRTRPTLYVATLSDSASRRELLRSAFYRPLDVEANP